MHRCKFVRIHRRNSAESRALIPRSARCGRATATNEGLAFVRCAKRPRRNGGARVAFCNLDNARLAPACHYGKVEREETMRERSEREQ